MKKEDFGYNDHFEKYRAELNLMNFEVGRVVAEHKERYTVKTETGDLEAEITGNLRFSAQNREDFPAVGDWVALTVFEPDFSVIHKVLPRFSTISRQAVGHYGEVQIIATNIDYALLVQAVDRDFNINRLERYLTLCYSSKVKPIIVLTKTDLIEAAKIADITEKIHQRIENVPVVALSNQTQAGYDSLAGLIMKGKTYCMLGSSGVGKSTLLNNLMGKTVMKTNEISASTNRGKHTTSHRELIVLENGGILIDNPGMREVGITDTAQGPNTTFDNILDLAHQCRFKDCSHTTETGCAVLEALGDGSLDKSQYENFMKIERERAFFESTVAERRKKDKEFGKILKDYLKKDIKHKQ